MRLRVLLVVMSLSAAVLVFFAACFPDYAYREGAGSADGSGGAEGSAGMPDAAADGSSDAPMDRATSLDTGPFDFDASGSVFIESGTFTLTQPGGMDQTVTHGFYMDKYEVTVARFRAWVDAKRPAPCDGGTCRIETPDVYGMTWDSSWNDLLTDDVFSNATRCVQTSGGGSPILTFALDGGAAFPITCATWYQALAFCIFDKKRLPTEVEWQMAATGRGVNLTYPWGGTALVDCSHAIFDLDGGKNGCGFPRPVGSANAGGSADGVLDLTGSVWEFMWDIAANDADFYKTKQTDYSGPDSGPDAAARLTSSIVLRGGSYTEDSTRLVLDPPISRYAPGPAQGDDTTGFRCVRTAP